MVQEPRHGTGMTEQQSNRAEREYVPNPSWRKTKRMATRWNPGEEGGLRIGEGARWRWGTGGELWGKVYGSCDREVQVHGAARNPDANSSRSQEVVG